MSIAKTYTIEWTGSTHRVRVNAGDGAVFGLTKGTPRDLPLTEKQASILSETSGITMSLAPDPPMLTRAAEVAKKAFTAPTEEPEKADLVEAQVDAVVALQEAGKTEKAEAIVTNGDKEKGTTTKKGKDHGAR